MKENKTPKPEKEREEKPVMDVPCVSVFQGQVKCKHLELKNKSAVCFSVTMSAVMMKLNLK